MTMTAKPGVNSKTKRQGMTEDGKLLIKRRRRNMLLPVAAHKKVCAEFKFWHVRSCGWRFIRFEVRVMKWEHFGILVVLVLAVLHLVESCLAKH
jgi:hypothetical protein